MDAEEQAPSRFPFVGSIKQRQTSTTEYFDDQDAAGETNASFAGSDIVFAVDCSASTRGLVLIEEKSAVTQIAEALSPEARATSTVLPWDYYAHPALDVAQVGLIKSGNGTTPTVLIHDNNSQERLQKTSIWCLITDGEIESEEVHDFASGIAEAGLHGIPSVVILAGYTVDQPIDCNISVGKAVFALASDSLFLFHDVEFGAVYVMQSKGCFNALLPPGQTSIPLDNTTSWKDLPKINYKSLASVVIPKKRLLSEDTIVLSSGRQLNLQDIYNDSVDDETAHEILSNNDNLSTVLLTASTRDCKDRVKAWLNGRRFRTNDSMWAPRPDTGDRSLKLISQIIDTLREDPEAEISKLSSSLRLSYTRSWQRFCASVDMRDKFEEIRPDVVSDAMHFLNLDDMTPHSPAILGPASPALARCRNERKDEQRPVRLYSYPATNTGRERRPREGKLLYTPGYRIREFGDHYRGQCAICGTPDSIFAILLKAAASDDETPGFPSPDARANHLYPMVLGAYPETDIIAPEVYCEICSYFMTRIGRSPKSDEITGSLPLICLKYSNAHGALQWTETIANALQRRFDDNIVLQIFLSALYYTIDDVSMDTPTTSLSNALMWACRSLVKVVRIPGELVETPRSGAPEVLGFEYLQDVLKDQLDSLRKKSNPLLNYPLDGFVSLIRAALDLTSVCQMEKIKDAVWLRLLFTLMEHHFELQAKEGEKVAREALNTLLIEKPSGYSQAGQTSSATEDGADESPDELTPMGGGGSQTANGNPELVIDTKKTSVSLETLQQTHLFPPDILEQYQRLASVFPEKEEWCARAIAVFLHVLYKESLGSRNATNLFGELKMQRRLRMIYWGRENVDQLTAADMISVIYRK
ncbi:uncharacterized protein LTHEOB_12836 [Lasiodiplodia theobromae]|uniref:uncharacterized protein n=1 Tax=Lasiodiplodia theobromae TaxID=45133 RepID=UPI0015C3CAF1|nr:uncharacterized protein LTHEOB_12836 [Lasiodiplodia theobromae]KAF4535099.1 hypothetical protein LTHEOB_12836 [Lasiodiplodia theobromae]